MTFTFIPTTNAQIDPPTSVNKMEVNTLVDSIAKLVEKYYVSLAQGKEMGDLILSKKEAYSKISDPNKLATQLTNDLRSINGDLHMSVNYNLPTKTTSQPSIEKLDSKGIWSNYGFQEVKVLDGNIGYLKIKHFTQWSHLENAKKTIDASFNFLQNSDALILDVRDNRGGFEEIVAYLISYLFEGESFLLSEYYYRYQDQRYGVYTQEEIPGKKRPNIPVYVLVNGRSASAAESLAYMLKHLKRATIIGETTMGAGNGAMTHQLDGFFSVTIASETTINAVTKTSFEQVGVVPNVEVASEEAFNTGYILALNHLKTHPKKGINPTYYEDVIKFLPRPESKMEIDKAAYQKYVGTYKDSSIEIVISMDDFGLSAEVIGRRGKLKLTAKDNHIFLVEGMQERVEFVLNDKNKIIKLIGLDSPMELDRIK
ncbi:MAG: hypothetical protein Sapg2KO_48530 [Saprospiraceae bacterium]